MSYKKLKKIIWFLSALVHKSLKQTMKKYRIAEDVYMGRTENKRINEHIMVNIKHFLILKTIDL